MSTDARVVIDPHRDPVGASGVVALTQGERGRVKHAIAPTTVNVNGCGRYVRPPACDPPCEEHTAAGVLVVVADDGLALETERCEACFAAFYGEVDHE